MGELLHACAPACTELRQIGKHFSQDVQLGYLFMRCAVCGTVWRGSYDQRDVVLAGRTVPRDVVRMRVLPDGTMKVATPHPEAREDGR